MSVDLQQIAAEVARCLGGNYVVEDKGLRVTALIGNADFGQDFGIVIREKPNAEMLRVWGILPKSINGIQFPSQPGRIDTSINVSSARAPDKIAKDIQKRFLPEYLKILKLGMSQRDEDYARSSLIARNAEMFAKIFGGNAHADEERVIINAHRESPNRHIHEFRCFEGSVSFGVYNLPIAFAKKFFEAWQACLPKD